MDRELLFKALMIAKPSLGPDDSPLLPLPYFCFMGDIVYAYDDVTAIIVEVETGLNCGIHGETLAGLLATVRVKEISIDIKGEKATLDVGNGKVELPTLPTSELIFVLPEEDVLVEIPLTPAALQALTLCLQTVGTDAAKPEFMGVTVRADKKWGIQFFSTNNYVVSRFNLSTFVGRKGAEAVLPVQACQHIIRLAADLKEPAMLSLSDRTAMVTMPNGITLVTKLFPSNAGQFDAVLARHLTPDLEYFDIPEDFEGEMRKAAILVSQNAPKDTDLMFNGGRCQVIANGNLGKMKTNIPINNKAVSGGILINPELVLKSLPVVSKMAINPEKSLVMLAGEGGLVQVVAGKSRAVTKATKEHNAAPPPPRTPKPGSIEDMDDDIPF